MANIPETLAARNAQSFVVLAVGFVTSVRVERLARFGIRLRCTYTVRVSALNIGVILLAPRTYDVLAAKGMLCRRRLRFQSLLQSRLLKISVQAAKHSADPGE